MNAVGLSDENADVSSNLRVGNCPYQVKIQHRWSSYNWANPSKHGKTVHFFLLHTYTFVSYIVTLTSEHSKKLSSHKS